MKYHLEIDALNAILEEQRKTNELLRMLVGKKVEPKTKPETQQVQKKPPGRPRKK